MNTKDNVSLKDLNRVFGLGPTAAWKLYKKGISSVNDLKKHSHLLTEHQKVGLKYKQCYYSLFLFRIKIES